MFPLTKLAPAVLALIYAQSAAAAPSAFNFFKRDNDLIRIPLNKDTTTGLYTIDVDFGKGDNVQTLSLVIDSGSQTTWVPGAKCTSAKCPGVESFYNASASKTARDHHDKEELIFEQGSIIADIYDDDICFGGAFGGTAEVKDFVFASACTIVGFSIDPTHGRLGLGQDSLIEALSGLGHSDIENYRKRQVHAGYPAFEKVTGGYPKKKRSNLPISELVLGIDPSAVKGEIHYLPLVCQEDIPAGQSIYWKTKLSTVKFNGKTLLQSPEAIVSFENGINRIVAPCDYAERIYNLIGTPQQGDTIFACEDVHRAGSLMFNFPGQKQITVPSTVWSQEIGSGLCEPLIIPSTNEESKSWILGTIVTDQFVEVFDQSNLQYGLGNPSAFDAEATISDI